MNKPNRWVEGGGDVGGLKKNCEAGEICPLPPHGRTLSYKKGPFCTNQGDILMGLIAIRVNSIPSPFVHTYDVNGSKV